MTLTDASVGPPHLGEAYTFCARERRVFYPYHLDMMKSQAFRRGVRWPVLLEYPEFTALGSERERGPGLPNCCFSWISRRGGWLICYPWWHSNEDCSPYTYRYCGWHVAGFRVRVVKIID
jgi:hypothetical protein